MSALLRPLWASHRPVPLQTVATGRSWEATIQRAPIGEAMGGLKQAMKRRGLRLKSARYAICSALLFASAALSLTPPPVVDESISDSEASWRSPSKPSDGLTMGKLKLQYEETTLPEVLTAIKLGSIQHQGDAAGSVYWLCYTSIAGDEKARIWIEASGEMGGPENRITNIAVQRISDKNPLSDCPALPKQFRTLRFNNGIWLGASEATVGSVFPSSLLRKDANGFIGYQGKVADDGRCDGGYDLLNSLYLTFQAGVVVAIDAGQVTSC
jgi:hypothetical protein